MIRILLIEDNADHRELMSYALAEHDSTWQIEAATSGEKALRRLAEEEGYDLLFLDYSLPGRNGLEVLEQIQQAETPPPVVMITGQGDEQVATKAMKGGAYDYVVKDTGYLQRLPVVARRAVEAHRLAGERKRAEEMLQYRLSFEKLVSGISASFINCPVEEIDEKINQALKSIAQFAGAVRSSVFLFSDDLAMVSNTHEWCAAPVDSQIALLQQFPFDQFGAYCATLKDLGPVVVSRPADMPPDGQSEREWSEKYGFRPALFVPMILGDTLYGTLGFYGQVDEERHWPEDFVLWLKFVADILVNALERRRAEEAMREISERFEKLAEASFDGIVLMENGILVEVNRTFASLYGYEPNEVIGMNAVDFIAPESKALVQNNVASGYDKPYEAIVLRKDGTKFAVEACGTAVTHKGRQARITAMRDITERKRAEESLRESEAMLAQAQQLAHLGNWEWDIINNKRTWSDEFYRILGLEPQAVEASFETFMERTHPDDREYVAKVEKELMAGHKSSVTLEHRMVQPDGTERFIQGRIRPQFDKKAKLVKMVGTMLDITERKQAEEALRESEEKYRSLVENIPDVTWTADRAGNTTFASLNIEKVYGYPPQEIYEAGDRLWLGRIHPDDLEQVKQAYELLFSENKRFDIEYRIQRKDGAWIWGRDRAITAYEKHGMMYADGIFSDITRRKLAEEALRVSEERFALAVQGSNDGLWDWDIKNNSLYWSPRLKELLGYADDELDIDFETFESLLHPDDREPIRAAIEVYLKEWGLYDVEQRLRAKSGEYRWCRARGQALWDEAGNPIRMVGSTTDITEQVRTEAEIQQKNEFLSNILESLTHPFYVIEANDYSIVTANSSALALGKATMNTCYALTHERSQPCQGVDHPCPLQEIKKTKKPVVVEHIHFDKNGATRNVEIHGFPLFNSQGDVVQVIEYCLDITQRMQAEADRERLLLAEREQRLLAETLREVTLALAAQTGRQAVLDEILRQVQRLVPYNTANIMLLEGDTIRSACWQGYEAFGSEKFISNLVQSVADFPLDAQVIRSQKPLVVPDTHREPGWVRFDETAWIRSYMVVPICHRNRVLGSLRLDSDTPGKFSPADAERLQPLANAAAIALENARLYEQALQDAKTKELLLREVNHRVKNNLAAIIGMLYIEQRYAEQLQDRRTYQATMDSLVNRIEGLAVVHDILSATRWSPLPLSELARQVINSVLQSLPPDKQVLTDISTAAPVEVTPEQANTLALVINELATNVVKYAVSPQGQTAHIIVRIALEDETILFEFRDDGPGFPEDVLRLDRQNVGMYLLQNTVRQNLRGQIRLHNDQGAVVTISFANAVENVED